MELRLGVVSPIRLVFRPRLMEPAFLSFTFKIISWGKADLAKTNPVTEPSIRTGRVNGKSAAIIGTRTDGLYPADGATGFATLLNTLTFARFPTGNLSAVSFTVTSSWSSLIP